MYRNLVKGRQVVVSTPIFYINASPHIGHLYTLMLSEYIKRAHLTNGNRTLLTSGTDEHGEKVYRAADKHRLDIHKYVDQQAAVFHDMIHKYVLDVDYFLRTTQQSHVDMVNEIWNLLVQKGFIKKENYEGWYSIREETFYQTRDLIEGQGGQYFTKEGDPVEKVTELNYMLKAKDVIKNPAQFIEEFSIFPSKKRNLLNEENFRDISISRPVSRVRWGVHLKSDPSCVAYVWFDALINYITALREIKMMDQNYRMSHPTTLINVVGKDIIKFHGVMFPIINKMAGMHFDQTVVCHDHWLHGGRKMSKSYANVVDPFHLLKGDHAHDHEKLKLYFLVHGPYNFDIDFSEDQIEVTYHTFIDKIVNCYSRVFSEGFQKNVDYEHLADEVELTPELREFMAEVSLHHKKVADSVSLENSPEAVWHHLLHYFDHVNNSITKFAPWTIKDSKKKTALVSVLVSALQYPLPFIYLFLPSYYKDLSSALLHEWPLADREHGRVDDFIPANLEETEDFEKFWRIQKSKAKLVVDHGLHSRQAFLREKVANK